MKRIFLLVLGFLILLVIAFGLWFFFFYTPSSSERALSPSEDIFGTFFDADNPSQNEFEPNFENLEETDFIKTTRIPILRQLSRDPIAGYTFFKKEFDFLTTNEELEQETKKEERYVFRFMERVTGHILETPEHEITTKKITNTTTQKVYNAVFSNNGDAVFFEKLNLQEESVDSFLGTIVTEEIENEIGETETETKLEIRAYSITSEDFQTSPSQNSASYIVKSSDSSSLIVDNFSGNKKTTLYTSPIREWLYSWTTPETILVTTKPSFGKVGYSYSVNTTNGSSRKILSEIVGLTAKLSPDGKDVLYSESSKNSSILRVKNLETDQERRLSISTLPEKCVFSRANSDLIYCAAQTTAINGSLPDDWYKGKIYFNDLLWKINYKTGVVDVFYRFDEKKYGKFDIVDLRITEKDEYLVFKNKRDLTLWSLNLKELDNENIFIPESSVGF